MMLLDQFGRPVRYIQKTDADINAEIVQELRAEEAALSQSEEMTGAYVTSHRVYPGGLAEYYAERTRLAKMDLPEDPNSWAAHNRRHQEAARAEREARKAAAAPAEMKQPSRRKSHPVTMGKWTRWP